MKNFIKAIGKLDLNKDFEIKEFTTFSKFLYLHIVVDSKDHCLRIYDNDLKREPDYKKYLQFIDLWELMNNGISKQTKLVILLEQFKHYL